MLQDWLTSTIDSVPAFENVWRGLLIVTYLVTAAALLTLPLPAYRVLRAKLPGQRSLPFFFGAFALAIVGILAVAPFAVGSAPDRFLVSIKFSLSLVLLGSARWIYLRFVVLSDRLARERELNAAEATALSEAQLRALANTQRCLVWLNGPNGAPYFYNDYCLNYLGFERGRFYPDDWLNLVHPADRERAAAEWAACSESGTKFSLTYRFREAASGEYRWFDVNITPQKGEDGKVQRWFGSGIEAPATVQYSEQLRMNQLRTEAILSAGPGAIGVFRGPDQVCEFADGQLREILGCADPIGKPLSALLGERSHEALLRLLREAESQGGRAERAEVPLSVEGSTGCGQRRHYHLCASVIPASERFPQQAVFFLSDRTEERRARTELSASEARFRRVFSSNLLGMFFWNVHGEITDANDAFLKLTGRTRADLQGLRVKDLWAEFYRGQEIQDAEELSTAAGSEPAERTLKRKDGAPVSVLAGSAWISRSRGEGISFVYDLTAQKKAEDDRTYLLAHAESAREASRLKSQFLANMSHEIRTPLHAVLGFSRLLSDAKLGAEEKKYVEGIEASGQTLLRLINDILDLSRLEANRLPLSAENLKFARTIEGAVAMIKAAQPGGVPVVLFPPADDFNVRADGVRLNQLLANIIGNAVKFTRAGQVEVRWESRLSASWRDITITVKDTGIGIGPNSLQRLFQPFEQGEGAEGRPYAGSGLGLWISRQLAQLMDGDITLASAPGQGTTATISLRLPEALGAATPSPESETEPKPAPIRFRGPRVLVAEDNELNQSIVRALLERLGCHPELAGTGAETLALVKAEDFDLLLLDCQLPDTDGYALAEAIRDLEAKSPRPRLPIIALTADAMRSARQRAEEAGMDDFLAKPLDYEIFLEKLAKQLGTFLEEEPLKADLSSLDEGALQSLRAVDPSGELAREVVGIFLRSTPARLARLNKLEASEDWAGLASELHALLACFGGVGLKDLAQACSRAEGKLQGARPGNPSADLRAIETAYLKAAAKLEEWLAAYAPAPMLGASNAGREIGAPRNW